MPRFLPALLLFACGPSASACPDGSVPSAGRCLEPDAGDAGSDAQPDIGPDTADVGRDASDASDASDVGPDAPDASACAETCMTPTPFCDATSGECVACRNADDCGGDTPLCDENGTCVTCRTDLNCTAAAPRCGAGMCVGCAGMDAVCERFDDTRLCGASGSCAACTGSAQCMNPAMARCDAASGTCMPCTTNPDCTGPGQNVCLTSGPRAGTCVECTAGDETACGPNVCDVAAQTCTTTPARTTGLCGECVSDRQCNEGQLCVPMVFGSGMTPVGNHCLWREDSAELLAPMGDCATVRPYVGGQMATSVGGVATRVCGLRNTTCQALQDFSMTSCSAPVTGDAMCGVPGVADGRCRAFGGGGMNRCTIVCGSNDDCKDGFTCDTGVTPNVCLF